ncbi:hypothetical protein BF93_17330 [Brachybacterium phenoliresistens]|uniref:DUF1963 domain-containing protein n=1 Tax=Brachybacterium phenoliresistens TaxID=396014 RepID=Z9JUA0_9MICO|nr:hypothetical protein [Brachybacterium phenoliresistens]EWS81376.1 hypothetical protein BF93_17330 [Brachybacterium phenoliresistens]
MTRIAADALYEVSYRSTWGAADGPLGHLVIRRLDDHAIVVEHPAATEAEARALLDRAEAEVRGPAPEFEAAWGIGPASAADPGPDVRPRPAPEDAAPDAAGTVSPDRAPASGDRAPAPGERVTAPDPRITVLPDPADVFAREQPWLARLLHPLVSVDLRLADPAWSGSAPLLSPVEPVDGLLGEETAAHHDAHAGTNWISLRQQADGRWRYLGARELFALEGLEGLEARGEAAMPGLRHHYAEAEAEIAGARARWDRLGALVWGDEEDPSQQRAGWGTDFALVDQLGGEPGYGNWAGFPPPPAYILDESDPVTPVLRLRDGRPFVFLAATAGTPWRGAGADAILLFVEPGTRTAVLTFDWS